MAKLTEAYKMEKETVIRFDETDEPALLYTASSKVKSEWMSLGYHLTPTIDGKGWRTNVQKDRVTFKPLKKAQKA